MMSYWEKILRLETSICELSCSKEVHKYVSYRQEKSEDMKEISWILWVVFFQYNWNIRSKVRAVQKKWLEGGGSRLLTPKDTAPVQGMSIKTNYSSDE